LLERSGTFFFLFYLKLGLRGSVFAVRSPPYTREGNLGRLSLGSNYSSSYGTLVVGGRAGDALSGLRGCGFLVVFWGMGRVFPLFPWLVGWLVGGIVCVFGARPGLRSSRTRRGREGIYHKQGTTRALSRIFFLPTCVRYRKQLRFRYRSSTFFIYYAFLTGLASASGDRWIGLP